MTKEELRKQILELKSRIQQEDSRKAFREMNEELEKLSCDLEDILYEELQGMSVKIVLEKIIKYYSIDTELLTTSYLDSGDLEKAFITAANEYSSYLEGDIKSKTIIK